MKEKRWKAAFDYEADGEGEISLTAGDLLRVIQQDSDREGWTLVAKKNAGTGPNKGWVPTEYIIPSE